MSNELLQLIGGVGLLCLLAGCFIEFNLRDRSLRPIGFLVTGLVYDLSLRWFFFKKEVYLLSKTSQCRRHVTSERVRRRADYGGAPFVRPKGGRTAQRRKATETQPATAFERAS